MNEFSKKAAKVLLDAALIVGFSVAVGMFFAFGFSEGIQFKSSIACVVELEPNK